VSFVYIDLEASGLGPDSYPIEVAWKDSVDGTSDNFLIDPSGEKGWDYWDEFAEELHGIAPEDLAGQLCASESAERLNSALSGRKVISDALEFDAFWVRRLFAAAGLQPTFQLV
jgi:DNA polymerase III epsilon subunit-like protein